MESLWPLEAGTAATLLSHLKLHIAGVSPSLIAASLLVALLASWSRLRDLIALRQYPLLRKSDSHRQRVENYMTSSRELLVEGVKTFPDQPFRMTSSNGKSRGFQRGAICLRVANDCRPGVYLILPNRLLDELKALPDSDIDAFRFLAHVYTYHFPFPLTDHEER